MRSAQGLLKPGLDLTDGAMGTYYAQLGPDDGTSCEEDNLSHPELISRIHSRYLETGAALLRTNTFAAITRTGPEEPDKLRTLIRRGYALAADCADGTALVAADIGPAYNLEDEQFFAAGLVAVEAFLDCGADLFLFETFADPEKFLPLCRHIRQSAPHVVLIASCVLYPDGLTRKGISLQQLSRTLEQASEIDIWGLNCGIGPAHIAEQAAQLERTGKPLILMPNSGYPRLENQRLVYGSEPDYFARVISGLANERVRLLGGCCGTTPRHIAAQATALGQTRPLIPKKKSQYR